MTWLELAERCEAATGPSRDLDLSIMRYGENIGGDPATALHYTTLFDAAMTLVPEDFRLTGLAETIVECPQPWRAILWERKRNTKRRPHGDGANPALALCAAALRARAKSSD